MLIFPHSCQGGLTTWWGVRGLEGWHLYEDGPALQQCLNSEYNCNWPLTFEGTRGVSFFRYLYCTLTQIMIRSFEVLQLTKGYQISCYLLSPGTTVTLHEFQLTDLQSVNLHNVLQIDAIKILMALIALLLCKRSNLYEVLRACVTPPPPLDLHVKDKRVTAVGRHAKTRLINPYLCPTVQFLSACEGKKKKQFEMWQ